MTFTTLTYNGVEKSLADWGINQATREVSNQAHDHFACDMMLPFDAADPLPYGAKITLQIGRVPASGSGLTAGGLPISGITSWSGGRPGLLAIASITFARAVRPWKSSITNSPGRGNFSSSAWSFKSCGGLTTARRTSRITAARVVLGLSVNALVGPTILCPVPTPPTSCPSASKSRKSLLMSSIKTTTDYGSPQLQSDSLTSAIDGVNYICMRHQARTLSFPITCPDTPLLVKPRRALAQQQP